MFIAILYTKLSWNEDINPYFKGGYIVRINTEQKKKHFKGKVYFSNKENISSAYS